MNEILSNVLMVVVTVMVPIVSNLLIKYVGKIADGFIAKIENDSIAQIAYEIKDRVEDSVAYSLQVYVDALKKAGNFGEDAQREALRLALEACKSSLSQAAKDYISKNFGDTDAYLKCRIEAEVKRQKSAA